MGDELSVKNIVGRTERDPWTALLGSRPDNYRIPEVGVTLIEAVDLGLFRRSFYGAVTAGIILEKWAEHDPHFGCKAAAVFSSICSVYGLRSEAERKLAEAKRTIPPDCRDCKAQYLKRTGTFYLYEHRHEDAYASYARSTKLFLEIGDREEAGKSMLNRGVALFSMKRLDDAMRDEEKALELLGDEFSMHVIAASINIARILTEESLIERALAQVESTQDMLKGSENLERPRLILRWIRALLLEAQGDLKNAGGMLDRIEVRMRSHDMKAELRVLFADRARVARNPSIIRRVAKKAYEMEEIPRVQKIIVAVMRDPTMENILVWRNALDSYITPFATV